MAASVCAAAAANVLREDAEMDTEKDDFDAGEFSQNALRCAMMAIRKSNELPSDGDDYDYYSSFTGFRKMMKVEAMELTRIMEKILEQQGIKAKLERLDLEEMFDAIVEANDTILERVGTSIDEESGLLKKEEKVVLTTVSKKLDINTSWNNKRNSPRNVTFRLLTGRNILRPQLKFKDKLDNGHGPFVPIIKEKPNSIKPLAIILEQTQYGEMFSHPYHCELNHFNVGEEHLKRANLEKPKLLEETPLHFIDSVAKLQELSSVLKAQKAFAVDLEHHSYRTFLGITCLMQISTREADYIVDTLELRSDVQLLNESFTDSKIVKVFHGADSDIDWLQRDLGLYVVNMFDTGQASRLLNFAHFSLGFLLKRYCQIDANKQFQLADWRIRPLPEEMIRYAREDTHYLLYIYDSMKNELLDKGNQDENLLLSVFQRSKVICEKRYVKPNFHEKSYMELYKKSRKFFNTRQLYALRELYKWRDAVARVEDESTGYVLPNHMLLQIAEVLPREQQGIFACCNPIPPFIRQYLNEIHLIILKSREQSLIKPIDQEIQIGVDARRHEVDLDNVLHCPHDFSHINESCGADTGPTILDMWNEYGDKFEANFIFKAKESVAVKKTAELSALVKPPIAPTKKRKKCADIESSFQSYCSPQQRYALVRPLLTRSTSEKSDLIKNAIDDVHDHFTKLAAAHGGEKQLEQTAIATEEQPLAESYLVDKETSPSDSQSNVIEEEAISIREKFMKQKKLSSGRKKRKLEGGGDVEISIKTKVEESSVNEAPELKKTKRGKKANKKNKNKKGTEAKVKTVEMESNERKTSFTPFNYNEANFKTFKGGSRTPQKKKKQFDPNGKFARNKGGGRRVKSKQRPQNKSLTYTTTSDKFGNSSKVSWPKE